MIAARTLTMADENWLRMHSDRYVELKNPPAALVVRRNPDSLTEAWVNDGPGERLMNLRARLDDYERYVAVSTSRYMHDGNHTLHKARVAWATDRWARSIYHPTYETSQEELKHAQDPT